MIVQSDGWLKSDDGSAKVVHCPSVRTTAMLTARPLALVWHATGGVGGPGFADGLARRIQTYRRGIDRAASWHLLIARDSGHVYQSAPLMVGTWHVGRPGSIAGTRYQNINGVTIGVELENAGELVHVRGHYYAYPYWLDKAERKPDPKLLVHPARVRIFEGRAYDDFTQAQAASATQLVAALSKHFGWGPSEFLHDHAEFAAPVKTDPGPIWMKRILPHVLSEALTDNGRTGVTAAPDFVTTPRS